MTSITVAVRRVQAAETAYQALPGAERALLGPRATLKRRAEFAAGRSAARAALIRLLGSSARSCLVLRAVHGETAHPIATSVTGGDPPAFVSITHASGFAVAIAGTARLGVDLVEVEPLGRAFREEAFSAGEVAAWETFTDRPGGDLAACAAFAAKEAVVKLLGTGLSIPLPSVRAVPASRGRIGRLGRLAVTTFTLDARAPTLSRRLIGLYANPGRFVLVAAHEQVVRNPGTLTGGGP